MKVGREYIKAGDKERKFSYTDVEYDPDNWVDANKYLPADYDLMYLKIKDKKTISGWAVGCNWDGLHFNDKDIVLYWKRKQD